MDEKSIALDIRDGMNVFERLVKRIFDFICSFLALIILSPVFLVVAFVLLCQGDGSVFFKQERIGYKGKPFNILKFRTMRADSESNGEPRLAAVNDERLTKVGKFLREHHLDELPQLLNVLLGDMSFVGPRPERRYFMGKPPFQKAEHSVAIPPPVGNQCAIAEGQQVAPAPGLSCGTQALYGAGSSVTGRGI